MAFLGGREIHPVSLRVGGFYKVPTAKDLRQFVEPLKWALDMSLRTVAWTAGLSFPDLERNYEFVSLRHPDEYPFNEGRIVSNKGVDIPVEEFLDVFEEEHVEHSTSLHAFVKNRGDYLAGPMSRYNNNFDKLPGIAQEAARKVGLGEVCRNPFKSIIVRAVELVFACHEALRIIENYEMPERPFVECAPREGTGHGCTEAPRGLLYHRYAIGNDGLIKDARIIPPTSQNQKAIEADLRLFVERNLHLTRERLTWECEQAVRNYDPCISCSCHFLRLKIVRE
jgi:coenzyme F420-reducing hydrogenase alpha subunit